VNILLDTHVLIWWIENNRRLGRNAKATIQDDRTTISISAVSIWEICIKAALERLDVQPAFIDELPREMQLSGFQPLPVSFEHAFGVRHLPQHHGDPFDRMLIAQAICENLTIVTADAVIRAYDVRTLDASI
jgi:PIN domain nuclease of toxin-antitoxin system